MKRTDKIANSPRYAPFHDGNGKPIMFFASFEVDEDCPQTTPSNGERHLAFARGRAEIIVVLCTIWKSGGWASETHRGVAEVLSGVSSRPDLYSDGEVFNPVALKRHGLDVNTYRTLVRRCVEVLDAGTARGLVRALVTERIVPKDADIAPETRAAAMTIIDEAEASGLRIQDWGSFCIGWQHDLRRVADALGRDADEIGRMLRALHYEADIETLRSRGVIS